jgi:hypothetical protein
MGLHTFSLFSLGTTFIRDGHKLVMIQQVPSTRIAEGSGRAMQLRVLDDVPDSTELEYPPVSNINVGTEAEAFVAKILRANGWRVVFYSRKKGYGFDLWAKKDRKTMVLEVKSSLSNLSSITLTPNEYEAAQHYKNNYFLMMVENISSDSPTVKMIQNPLSKLSTVQVTVESYRISANNWRKHAIKIEL